MLLNVLKKSFKTVIMIFSFVFVFTSFNQVKAAENDNDMIKNVVTQYLSWELESVNTLSNEDILKLDTLVKNDILKDFKISETRLSHEWNKQLNDEVEEYQNHIEIISVDIVGNKATVNVNYGYNLRDKNSDVLQEFFPVPHKIELVKEGVIWKIENDFFTNLGFNYEFDEDNMKNFNKNPMEIRTGELKENLNNVEEQVSLSKNSKAVAMVNQFNTKGYNGYNNTAAANYAVKWAEGRNPAYIDYGTVDCTNFVSQAMLAGGLPVDGTWYKHSSAWRGVVPLRHWLVNKGYTSEYVGQGWYAGMGNLVQFNKTGNQWSHTVMITQANMQTGKMYVSAHSNNALNIKIETYYQRYPNGTRFLTIK